MLRICVVVANFVVVSCEVSNRVVVVSRAVVSGGIFQQIL